MHTKTCICSRCCFQREAMLPVARFSFPPAPRTLSEEQEVELAMELLGVSTEEELDQFLGKLVRGIGRGLKKVGKLAGKVLKPLGGALKGLAKKALPFVGGALGSLIPIPGVGTAIGTAVGSAVSKAMEMEVNELEQDEAEFEMARRFVRIAADATQQALVDANSRDAGATVRNALLGAVRSHVPQISETELEAELEAEMGTEMEGEMESEMEWSGEEFGEAEEEEVHHLGRYGGEGSPTSGRWRRRGRRIALFDL